MTGMDLQRQKREAAAFTVQSHYRAYRARSAAKTVARHDFCKSFGENGNRASVTDLCNPSSSYLPCLGFFFDSENELDICRLVSACELFVTSTSRHEWQVFSKSAPLSSQSDAYFTIRDRLKRFAILCFNAYLSPARVSERLVFLKTLVALTNPASVFGEEIHTFLVTDELPLFYLECAFQIIDDKELSACDDANCKACVESELMRSCMEDLLYSLCFRKSSTETVHVFILQIFLHRLLWKKFPSLAERLVQNELFLEYLRETKLIFAGKDSETGISCRVHMIENALSVATELLTRSESSFCHLLQQDRAAEVLTEVQYTQQLLHRKDDKDFRQVMPRMLLGQNGVETEEDESTHGLKARILRFIFLYSAKALQVYCDKNRRDKSYKSRLSTVFTALLYTTKISLQGFVSGMQNEVEMCIQKLWEYIKLCENEEIWPAIGPAEYKDFAKWIGPLNIFCFLLGAYMEKVDYQRLFKEQKLMPLEEIKTVIKFVKQKLWDALWKPEWLDGIVSLMKLAIAPSPFAILRMHFLMLMVIEWNCRSQFMSWEDFTVDLGSDFRSLINHPLVLIQASYMMQFKTRVGILRYLLKKEETQRCLRVLMNGPVTVTLKRNNLLEDAVIVVNSLSVADLRRGFQVEFVNEFGERETGLDIGASFKEFVETVTSEAFDPKFGLFKESERNHLLYPDPASGREHTNHLRYFEFLGKILGKAMLEGIILDLSFNGFFVKQLIEQVKLVSSDLLYLDPQLHNSLLTLKWHPGDLSELGLYFVTANEFGEQVELVEDGSQIPVSSENVNQYIDLMADYLLNKRIANEAKAFRDGFYHVVDQVLHKRYVWMFNVEEMSTVLFGSSRSIDVEDLKAHTVYQGYKKDSPTILMFWEVVQEFNDEQRKMLFKFVTGNTKGPCFGFEHLIPCFSIVRERGDLRRLPTSSTCENMLKLPRYKRKEVLQKKLLKSINAEVGKH